MDQVVTAHTAPCWPLDLLADICVRDVGTSCQVAARYHEILLGQSTVVERLILIGPANLILVTLEFGSSE